MNLEEQNLKHIAVILDGNRRYAKSKAMQSFKGHDAGAETFEKFLEWSKDLQIKEVTAYILSTENLKREKSEVEHLFNLFQAWFKKFIDSKQIHENKVKIRFIGDLSLVPENIRKLAGELQEKTKNYDNYILNFCFAYGGRLELINAFNKLLKEKVEKNNKEQITEEDIKKSLWLSSEPDLIIRTGNVKRTSNFLPWQSTYSEWIFLEKMWPEFTKQDLIDCIQEFKSRKRNFGK